MRRRQPARPRAPRRRKRQRHDYHPHNGGRLGPRAPARLPPARTGCRAGLRSGHPGRRTPV